MKGLGSQGAGKGAQEPRARIWPFVAGAVAVAAVAVLWTGFSRYAALADEAARIRAENAQLKAVLACRALAGGGEAGERIKRYSDYLVRRLSEDQASADAVAGMEKGASTPDAADLDAKPSK